MKHKDEWDQLMEHLRHLPQSNACNAPLRLPNYLLINEQEECMYERIQQMAELLKEKKLMRFVGECSCVFWTMTQAPDSHAQLLDALDAKAGFHNRFLGVVALEITAVTEGGETLRKLSELARDSYGELLLVYLLHGRKRGKSQALQRVLSEATPLDVMSFDPVTEEDVTVYLTRGLEERDVRLSSRARKALAQQIAAMQKEGDCKSFSVLDNLCELIAYRAGTWNAYQENVTLSVADVRRLAADFQRLKRKTHTRTIGFGGE